MMKHVGRDTLPNSPPRHWAPMPHRAAEMPGRAVCTQCQCEYENHRWIADRGRFAELMRDDSVARLVCNACFMQQEKLIEGAVMLRGDWSEASKDGIMKTVRNEERRAMQKNPQHRIVSLEDAGNGLVVTTTSNFLARRLAAAIRRAFGGRVVIHEKDDERFVEIDVVK